MTASLPPVRNPDSTKPELLERGRQTKTGKPHPDIHLKSLAKLGLRPDEVIHVCRVQLDVFGAKAAGVKVAWINRAQEPLEAFG